MAKAASYVQPQTAVRDGLIPNPEPVGPRAGAEGGYTITFYMPTADRKGESGTMLPREERLRRALTNCSSCPWKNGEYELSVKWQKVSEYKMDETSNQTGSTVRLSIMVPNHWCDGRLIRPDIPTIRNIMNRLKVVRATGLRILSMVNGRGKVLLVLAKVVGASNLKYSPALIHSKVLHHEHLRAGEFDMVIQYLSMKPCTICQEVPGMLSRLHLQSASTMTVCGPSATLHMMKPGGVCNVLQNLFADLKSGKDRNAKSRAGGSRLDAILGGGAGGAAGKKKKTKNKDKEVEDGEL